MEYVDTDFMKLMDGVPQTQLTEEHIVTILYNQVCAMNFVHSAGVIHRDIKPANFLIDTQCGVKICDFGQSRIIPGKTNLDKETIKFRKSIRGLNDRKSKMAEFLENK